MNFGRKDQEREKNRKRPRKGKKYRQKKREEITSGSADTKAARFPTIKTMHRITMQPVACVFLWCLLHSRTCFGGKKATFASGGD